MARTRRSGYASRGPGLRLAESRPNMTEFTSSGMTYYVSAGMRRRLRDLEYLADLAGDRAYYAYDRMRRSDPHIFGIARAFDLPLIDATWRVQPASALELNAEEKKPEASAQEKKVCQAVEDALSKRQLNSWRTTMQEFLLYPYYGYAPFEVCWKVEDEQVWFDRFAWVPPTTVSEIFVRRGRVDGIEQNITDRPANARPPFVPGEKLLWFTNQKEGDNYRGVSLLRPMHKDWFAKEKAQIMFLILAERMGGVLHIETPKNATASDKAKADELGHNFRVGDSLYIRSPEGWNIDLKGVPLQLGDLRQFINDCDTAISDAALAQHLDLSKSDNGSYALAGSLRETFLSSVQSKAKYIADTMNAENGPIHQFVVYNFGDSAWESVRPQLSAGRVSRMNIATVSDALLKLYQAGYPMGPEMWKFIAEESEFPAPDEELMKLKQETEKKLTKMKGDPAAMNPNGTPPTNNVPDTKSTGQEKKAARPATVKAAEDVVRPFEDGGTQWDPSTSWTSPPSPLYSTVPKRS